MTNQERALANVAYVKQQENRKKNAKAVSLNTELSDSSLGEGETSLVNRRNMIGEINTLQKEGSLQKTDKGYFITDESKKHLMQDDVFKRTLGTVSGYNDGLVKQQEEKAQATALAEKNQAQINAAIAENGNAGVTGEQANLAATDAVNAPPVGTMLDQFQNYWDNQTDRNKVRNGLLLADAGSTAVSMIPGGNILSTVVGLTSTAGNAYLDFTSEEESIRGNAWKNLGMGLAMDGVGLVGGKSIKGLNSIAKLRPWLKGAVPLMKGAMAGMGAMQGLDALKKIKFQDLLDRDISTWDTSDYMTAVTAARFLMGSARNVGRATLGRKNGIQARQDARVTNKAQEWVSPKGTSDNLLAKHQKAYDTSASDFKAMQKNVDASNKRIQKADDLHSKAMVGNSKRMGYNDAKKNYQSTKDVDPEQMKLARKNYADSETAYSNSKNKVAEAELQKQRALSPYQARQVKATEDFNNNKPSLAYKNQKAEVDKALNDVINANGIVAKSYYRGIHKRKLDDYNTLNKAHNQKAVKNLDDEITNLGAAKDVEIARAKAVKGVEKSKRNVAKTDADKYKDITEDKIKVNKENYDKSNKLVKRLKVAKGSTRASADVDNKKLAQAKQKKNKADDELTSTAEKRLGDDPKGTIAKAEKKHRGIEASAKKSARDKQDAYDTASAKYKKIKKSDKANKAKAKQEMVDSKSDMDKSQKAYQKQLDDSSAAMAKESDSWRKFDRGVTGLVGKAYTGLIGGAGNLAGKFSITGSDVRHVSTSNRASDQKNAEDERKKLGKKSKSQVAIQKAKDFRAAKAKKAKAKKEKEAKNKKKVGSKRLGGKLVVRPHKVQIFQKGGLTPAQQNIIDLLYKGIYNTKTSRDGKVFEKPGTDSEALDKALELLQKMSPEDQAIINKSYKDKYKESVDDAINDEMFYQNKTAYNKLSAKQKKVEATAGWEERLAKFNPREHLPKDTFSKDWFKGRDEIYDRIAKSADPNPQKFGFNYYANSIADEEAKVKNTQPGNYNPITAGFPSDAQEEFTGQYSVDKHDYYSTRKDENGNCPDGWGVHQNGSCVPPPGYNPDGTKKSDGAGGDVNSKDPKDLADEVTENEEAKAAELDQDLKEVSQPDFEQNADFGKEKSPIQKKYGFGNVAGDIMSKVNMGDLYNIGQLFKKPSEYTANFTPMQATTLASRNVGNMAGYDEMKAEASKPTYNVKTNDLQTKMTLERRNQNMKNNKLQKLGAMNAQHVDRLEAGNAEIENKNRANATQTRNQNAQQYNQREMMNAQLQAKTDAEWDKKKAQTLGSIGIRLNQGAEEAMYGRAQNKLENQSSIVNNYNGYMSNRMDKITSSRDNEVSTLTDEYNVFKEANGEDAGTLDQYLETNKNKGAQWNKFTDDELKTQWEGDYTKEFGYTPTSDAFTANTRSIYNDVNRRGQRIKLDPKNA